MMHSMSFQSFVEKIQNDKGFTISCIRSDHEREFENVDFESFCDEHGIENNFLSPRTPKQNGVVERKNRTLQEITRTMLHENNLSTFMLYIE